MQTAPPTCDLDREQLENVVTEITRQIVEHGLGAVGQLGNWGCSTICVEVCPDRVNAVLSAGACRVGLAFRDAPSPTNLGAYIDNTLLKPEATLADIDTLCSAALENSLA